MPAFRSISSVAVGTRTNTTVTAPAGAQNGDVIVIGLSAGASAAVTVTPPSGWTSVSAGNYTAPDPYNIRLSMWSKVYAGEASWTFTHSAASSTAVAAAYQAVDNTTPLDVAGASAFQNQLGAGGGTVAVAPSITTATAASLGIVLRGSWDGTAITPPAGWMERYDSPTLWLGEHEWTAAGATGTVSVPHGNPSNNDLPWGIIHGALRPGVAPTPLATPTVTVTAENDPTTVGGSNGSIVGTYTTVANADRYEIGIRTGHGQTTGFTQVDDDGPTPFTITGRVAGDYTVGVRAHPAS